MANAEQHASTEGGSPEILEKFQEMNPNLREVESHRYCGNLHTLLTNRHRHQGHCEFGDRIEMNGSCFTAHEEAWQDLETGLPLIVAHSYCPHTGVTEMNEDEIDPEHRQEHRDTAERLAQRGLAYRASRGSWYHPGRSTLVVIARADVAAGINKS